MAEEGTFKVAIIGAGWAGLQLLQSLKELGIHAEIFEGLESVGGTWSPHMSYHALSTHSPLNVNTMTAHGKPFPFKDMPARYLEKADAKEMHEYLNSFVDKMDLREFIHCSSRVREIHYDTRSREAHLVVESSGSSSRKGPFNLVVFAAFAAFPSVPRIWNHGFEGQVLHSSELKDGIMDEILRKKSKVLVVGAGKSGCDMVCAFQKRGYQNLTWLYRSPYWFMNYEAIIFKLTPLNMLRGAMVCNLLTLFLVSGKVALFILWLIGAFTQPKSDSSFPSHFDASKFHFGLLDRKQVDYIRQVPGKVGEPKTLGKEGMVLESEEVIPCDVVIFATGYDTGMQRLRLLKDGKVVEDVCDQPLFHHTVTPCLAALKSLAWVSERLEDASRLRNFPCLLIATTAYYTFGPARGLSLAQYITYYLEAEPSEEVMMKSAARNWSKQFAAKSGVFTSDRCFVQQWLLFYLDLWKNGLMSFYSFLKMVVCLFVFMIYMPLELKVGRKLRYEAASY